MEWRVEEEWLGTGLRQTRMKKGGRAEINRHNDMEANGATHCVRERSLGFSQLLPANIGMAHAKRRVLEQGGSQVHQQTQWKRSHQTQDTGRNTDAWW